MNATGSFACPICGKETPHTHSAEEVEHHNETEAWVEERLRRFHEKYPQFFPNRTKEAGHG